MEIINIYTYITFNYKLIYTDAKKPYQTNDMAFIFLYQSILLIYNFCILSGVTIAKIVAYSKATSLNL